MSPSQLRLLRIGGIGICLTLLLLRTLLLLKHGTFLHSMSTAWWLIPMVSFVVALCLGTSPSRQTHGQRLLFLAAQSVSVLVLAFTMGGQKATSYEGYLLLVIAVQIALALPLRIAVLWILTQSSLLAVSYVVADHSDYITATISVVFKVFTYAIVVALKHEADARAEFAALHAQSLASREVYADRSRQNERLRIARDLHDVMGHRLTALSLNLEIAMNKPTMEAGRTEVEFAQTLTKDLLGEVREVVSAMRPSSLVDLHEVLQRVANGFAPVAVHLHLPEELHRCEALRAEVLVRCTQELVTNAVKHARARQIWIDLEMGSNQVLRLQSRDDGAAQGVTVSSIAGIGLESMRERFESLGGSILAERDPDKGFMIQGFLPMQAFPA